MIAKCALVILTLRTTLAAAADIPFDFTLSKPAVTSAGIYDADGRLVRVLWTMDKLDGGKFTRSWDGKDNLGHDAPRGVYAYKVVANRGTYANVGAIGNSGLPADAAHHTPSHIASIAVDDEGSVYSANGWDEAGADFKKWDKDGNSVFDANYSIRNGKPNGAPYAIAVDDKYIYCSVGGWANAEWKEAQQIQRFSRTDGKPVPFSKTGREDGHIQVYEWPSRMIPAKTSKRDTELMKLPLRALAVNKDMIFCADALGKRILKFDKVSGESRGELSVTMDGPADTRPLTSLAFDRAGQLWGSLERCSCFVVSPQETGAEKIESCGNATPDIGGMAFGPDNRMYLAADYFGLRIFKVTGKQLEWTEDFGKKAGHGDRAADHFFHLTSVAVDKDGNIFTAQDEPFGGARLAKFSPDHKILWEHFGCEFVSLGNYGVDNPDAFYSMSFHDYHLLDHNAGKWQFTGNGSPFMERKFISDVHGVPRVIKLGEHTFYFLPSGDGVQVHRLDDNGKVFHLAALVGGRSPAPDGSKETRQLAEWTWHDADGVGDPKADQVNYFRQPGLGHYSCFGMDVDAGGNIVFANTSTHSIWTIPIGPLDGKGNPIYDWKDAKEAFPRDTSWLKFEPNMAQRAADGSFYAFGWSDSWPAPKNNPFWMGGTTLARFDKNGRLLWAVPVPRIIVGLDVIPGGAGGCFVGEGKDARIDHYSADGLLIGSMQPGDAMCKQTGWFDNHASVAVNRDPRDHVLDVFAEDDYVLRIGWYRVDDRDVETLAGEIKFTP